jgi:prepilin-type N-terminal cleavage/methylation domain-containing protein
MLMEYSKGFTLVEILVSISILTLITGSMIFNYRGSSDNFNLNSAAQELAIAVRQAQSYGLSVKESGVGTGSFSYAYGIYAYPILDPTSYYLFVDRNGNDLYDPGSGSCGASTTECVEKVTLRNGVLIDQVCLISSGSNCSGPHNGSLAVTFLRPNPDADVNYFNSSGIPVMQHKDNGRIKLISSQGKLEDVTIYSTGQITVETE